MGRYAGVGTVVNRSQLVLLVWGFLAIILGARKTTIPFAHGPYVRSDSARVAELKTVGSFEWAQRMGLAPSKIRPDRSPLPSNIPS